MYDKPLPKSVFDFLTVSPVGYLSYPHLLETHKFSPENEEEKAKYRTWLVLEKEAVKAHPFFKHLFTALDYYGKTLISPQYKPGGSYPLHGLRSGEQEAAFEPPDGRDAKEFFILKVHCQSENKPKIIYDSEDMTEDDIFAGRDAQLLLGLYSWKKNEKKGYGPGINVGLKAVKILTTGKPILSGTISQEKAIDAFETAQAAIAGQTVDGTSFLPGPGDNENDEEEGENKDELGDKDADEFDPNKLIDEDDGDPPF